MINPNLPAGYIEDEDEIYLEGEEDCPRCGERAVIAEDLCDECEEELNHRGQPASVSKD